MSSEQAFEVSRLVAKVEGIRAVPRPAPTSLGHCPLAKGRVHDLESGTLREKACAVAHCTAGDVSSPQAAWLRRYFKTPFGGGRNGPESTSRWMLADIGFCLIFSKSRRRGPRLTAFLFR